ncbi:MAG: SBBP repeat-containing protein [Candidatus Sulfotelmatobacter sp.]
MKTTAWSTLFLLSINFVFAVCSASAQADQHFVAAAFTASAKTATPADQSRFFLDAYAKLPLRFEANQGQSGAPVRFLSRGEGYTLFLTPTEAVLSLSGTSGDSPDSLQRPQISIVGMEWLGSRPDAAVAGLDELPGKSNYFIGNDPKQWHVGVPAFGRVSYKNIYSGVDLVFYGNQRHLEYDFVIAPGADPNSIKLKISGARGLRVDKKGNLFVGVGSQDLQLSAPNVYQEEAGKKHAVEGRWIRSGRSEVRFALGAYDHNRTLVVDPTLSIVYSTYLGGSAKDDAYAVTFDSSGDAYVTGSTVSPDFPTTPGAYQTTCGGCSGSGTANVFITEMNPTGSGLIYSTFLGGSNGDGASGIAIDSSGDAYVVGATFSSNFPVPNGFQTTCAGDCTNGDAFVTELNSTGSTLVFSSFLGGTGTDVATAVALDSQGNAYVVGSTNSTVADGFPITTNAYQGSLGGEDDAFVTEVRPPSGDSANASIVYSTYLGGSDYDEGASVALDSAGSIYVTGYTNSSSTPFPTTSGAYQTTCSGCANGFAAAFVAKFSASFGALDYSTLLGGSTYPTGAASNCPTTNSSFSISGDCASAIAVDATSHAYVTGAANSTNFPTTAGSYQSTCADSCPLGGHAFVTKFNPSGSALVYSSYLGGNGADEANRIAVDSVGNAFVTGKTSSSAGLFSAPNPNYNYQPGCASCASSGTDAYIAEFDVAGNALVFSSYLGGTTAQSSRGVAVASNDESVIAGWTSSTDFPTANGYCTNYGCKSTTGGGSRDAFVAAFPAAANCTTTNSLSGLTLTASLACTGHFASSNSSQNVGFTWGDGTDTEYPGCTSPCTASAGTVSLSTTHTYSGTGSATVTPVVTDASGTAIITTPFTVSFAPTITTQPASQTIESGQTATLMVVATGTAPLSYQWYQGASGTTTTPISGATSSSYTTPSLTASESYWVQVSNSVGSANSTAATITVVAGLMIGTTSLPSDTNGTAYSSTTLVATGGVPPYTWSIPSTSRPFPPGLSLSSAGVITGTPTTDGTFDFTVEVTDSALDIATANLSIAITTPPGAPTCTAPTVAVNSASNPLSVTATSNCTDSTGTIQTTTVNWGDGSTDTMTNGQATHVYTFSSTAPNKCVVGTGTNPSYCKYAITVTATDTNDLSATASGCITLTPPVEASVSSGQSAQQSAVANAPLGVPMVSVTYTCATAYGPAGEQTLGYYALQCNINGAGNGVGYSTTLSGTPSTIQVTVQTGTSGSARMFPRAPERNELGWLYAAFLALPGVVLLGTGASRTKKRKGKIVQYAGLVLLAILMCGWLGCSSSSLSTPTPSGYPTPSGSYAVGVVGTDSSGNTQSTITVGFTVGS